MDINAMLSGVDCACGKRHECDIQYVYIERGAISRLREICESYKRILVVADTNTFAAAGDKTLSALGEKLYGKVIFDGSKILIPNEESVETVKAALGESDLIVGIGSGVIQDLSKYVSHTTGVPYMVVATAPSMDGYASNGAAMIMGGMKVTYSAGLPRAIVADTEVIANAPMDMIKAGYGDIVGKYSALNDWKLSNAVNGEYLCDYIYSTTMEMVEKTLTLADGLLLRDETSVGTLMEALVVVGILMSFAGSSRPASGSEHHLSHFFEIVGIVKNEEYFPHGIDVAYSTVITAKIREQLLSGEFPKSIYRESREALTEKLTRIYGSVADGCIALQDKVGNYALDRSGTYLEKEETVRAILSEMPTAREIEEMLSKVGLDISEFYSLYGEKKINEAIAYAKDLKDRYTVLWVNYDFGRCNK